MNLSIQDVSILREFNRRIHIFIVVIISINFSIIFNLETALFEFIKYNVWFNDQSLSLESVKDSIIKSLDHSNYDDFKTIDREIIPRITKILKQKASDEKIKLDLNSIPESDIKSLSTLYMNYPTFATGYYELVMFLRLIKEDPEKYTELMKSFKVRLEGTKKEKFKREVELRAKQEEKAAAKAAELKAKQEENRAKAAELKTKQRENAAKAAAKAAELKAKQEEKRAKYWAKYAESKAKEQEKAAKAAAKAAELKAKEEEKAAKAAAKKR
jgi:hypothetical protein